MYKSMVNAKREAIFSRVIKKSFCYCKANKAQLGSRHHPHNSRAPKTTRNLRMLTGLARRVLERPTRRAGVAIMANADELRGMDDQLDCEEVQYTSISDGDASLHQW